MSAQNYNRCHFSVLSTPARCDGSGNPCHLHTDWQGSVTMVTDKKGKILQHNGYYPYGEPWRKPSGQPYLFSSKERLRQHTLTEYDFTARRYNSALLLWTTPDPLADSYPPNHPLIYCASNPLKFTDPTGMEIIVNGSMDENDKMEKVLNYFRGNELYNTVMRTIDESCEVFTIIFKDIPTNPDGKKSNSLLNKKDKIMTVDKDTFYNFSLDVPSEIYNSVAEEFYHMYQLLIPEYWPNNIEYEAKIAAFLGSYTKAGAMNYSPGVKEFTLFAYTEIAKYDTLQFPLISRALIDNYYKCFGNIFSLNNKNSSLPHYGDKVYFMPKRLKRLLNNLNSKIYYNVYFDK